MEGAKHPIRFELNWFPAFSYAAIPADYKEKIPENWLKALEPVRGSRPADFPEHFHLRRYHPRL